ncbi:MAG: terminase large subunit [Limnochordia bacterium]|jgi:phage terminase large subunit-like protein
MERANKVLTFVGHLKHSKAPWAGLPFEPMPWQVEFIRELYGTLNPDGTRQYRQALLYLPRKNGKSFLAAALALYHLIADDKHGAEVYLAAGSREQASVVFNQCRDFVRGNRTLSKRLRVIEYSRRIIDDKTASVLRALSADGGLQHGLNPTAVIADELHVWEGKRGRELWEALVTSFGGREEPLLLCISTAGYDRTSLFWELYDYAKRVQEDPARDPTFLPCLYEADPEDDWLSIETWKKANPALGEFRSFEDMEALATRAKESAALENSFRRLYLNQWTSSEVAWIPADKWSACDGLIVPERLKGRECYGGLDLSATTDLAAFVLVFPNDDDPPSYDVLPYFWLPEARATAERRDVVDYRAWARVGYLKLMPGEVLDQREIKRDIQQLADMYLIKEIAFDRWNAFQLAVELEEEGAKMVSTGMGYASMSMPTKTLEELVLAKRMHHGGHPVLAWNIANVVLEQDAAGNIKPSKARSKERIDGAVALILAISRAILREPKPTVYRERGLLVI